MYQVFWLQETENGYALIRDRWVVHALTVKWGQRNQVEGFTGCTDERSRTLGTIPTTYTTTDSSNWAWLLLLPSPITKITSERPVSSHFQLPFKVGDFYWQSLNILVLYLQGKLVKGISGFSFSSGRWDMPHKVKNCQNISRCSRCRASTKNYKYPLWLETVLGNLYTFSFLSFFF